MSERNSDKFDYYIAGLSAAAFAYLFKDLQAEPLGVTPYTVKYIGEVCLLFSLLFGLKRIEAVVVLKRLNFDLLHYNESAGVLAQGLEAHGPGDVALNLETGLQADQNTLKRDYNEAVSLAELVRLNLKDVLPRAERYGKLRNLCLGIAAVMLIVAQTWLGYYSGKPAVFPDGLIV